MSDRYLKLFLSDDWHASFSFVTTAMKSAGLSIEDPHHRKVFFLPADGGERQILNEQLDGSTPGSIQFWTKNGDDVIVGWKRDAAAMCFLIHFSGIDFSVESDVVASVYRGTRSASFPSSRSSLALELHVE